MSEKPPSGRIAQISARLKARGIDPGHLNELQEELDLIERPPGIFSRLTDSLRQTATYHWRNVVGELQESAEVMSLIRLRLRGERALAPAEQDKIRSQVLDLLRAVPAGMIAMGTAAIPIPGTELMTPWILSRLGLMPSRWREAHLLAELQSEQRRLRAQGHQREADEIEALYHTLEQEADAREIAARDATLLTFWDANRNGVWDAEERLAYDHEVEKLLATTLHLQSARRWFLLYEGQVFGPYRLSDLAGADVPPDLLVCLDGKTGWVSLRDILMEHGPRS